MALQRGGTVRMASDVSDADILSAMQAQQPAASPEPLDTTFNPVGFDWSQGAQNINGTIYQPIFDDQGALQSIYKYRQGQIGAGQPYEALDPNTGQKTGEGQFQATGGFGSLLRTAAQDLGPLALAALGVNPALAAPIGGAAGSALGISGLTAGQTAALGSGLASTGIGLAQGQSPLEALKTGLTTGAGGLFSGVGGGMLPSTGNAVLDKAIVDSIQSGVRAKLTGKDPVEAITGSLLSSGVGAASGIDPKIVGNAVNVIASGGDPQQIFNTIVSAAQGGLIPGAAAPATPAGTTLPQDKTADYKALDERLQQIASTAEPFESAPYSSQELGQALVDLQQGAGIELAFAGAIPGLVGAASETAAAAAARAAITRALQSSAEVAVPAIQQAAAASPAVAQALASPAVQRLISALGVTALLTKEQLQPLTQAEQEAKTFTGPFSQITGGGQFGAAGGGTLPGETWDDLATTQTAPKTTAKPATATPTAPNINPLQQLVSQTTGTAYDVTGDPYALETEVQTSPGTIDAQRLARVLNTDINTANALISANPEIFGNLIGGSTTGSTPPDFEKMTDVQIRTLLAEMNEAASGTQSIDSGNVIRDTQEAKLPTVTQIISPEAKDLAQRFNLYEPVAQKVIDSIMNDQILFGSNYYKTDPSGKIAVNVDAISGINLKNRIEQATKELGLTSSTPSTTPQTQPAVTPAVTAGAQVTARPAVTTAPTVTSGPSVTAGPVVTAGPAVTAKPTITAGPTLTTGPTVTAGPVVTPVVTPLITTVTTTSVAIDPIVSLLQETVTTTKKPVPPVISEAVITTKAPTVPINVNTTKGPVPRPTPPIEGIVEPPLPPGTPPPSPLLPEEPSSVQPTPGEPPVTPEPPVTTTPGPVPTTPPPPTEPPATTPGPATTTPEPPTSPPRTTAPPEFIFDPATKTKVLTEALTSFTPSFFKGRVGAAYYRPAGEIESEVTGKKRRDVWNEASLRLKDALGL